MNKQNSKPDGQHDSWMPEDDELLRKHYKDIGLKVASLLPGHYSGMGPSLLPG